MTTGMILGWVAAGFALTSFLMKDMVRLRLLAMAANAAFMGYGYYENMMPTMGLHAGLLLLNCFRLVQIVKLTIDIREATLDSPVSVWLLPHMKKRRAAAGTVLFNKGDTADRMFYVRSGTLKLAGYGDILGPGSLVGEIGLFSPDRRRTQSIVCETDCDLYELTDEGMYRLYFQNPKLGFHVMRLVVARLIRDVEAGRNGGPATAGAAPVGGAG